MKDVKAVPCHLTDGRDGLFSSQLVLANHVEIHMSCCTSAMQPVAFFGDPKCSQQHPIDQWENKLYLLLCGEDIRGIVLSWLEVFELAKYI